MQYKNIVNEKLRIAAISISDLTIEYVEAFLDQWDDDSHIGSLTLYYDRKEDYLVLNQDNEHYEIYLELAEALLGPVADMERGRELLKKFPYSIRETVEVLKNCRQSRKAAKELGILRRQPCAEIENACVREVLDSIAQRDCPQQIVSIHEAYMYGIMQGKRAERAKRKVRAAS